MGIKLADLAVQIGAELRGPAGAGEVVIERCATLEAAGPAEISFLSNPKYASHLAATQAGAVVVSPEIQAEHLTLLVAGDPYYAFRNAVVALHGFRRHPAPGVSPEAFIDDTAEIGELCTIRPFAYIAPRAKIGKRCVIYPGCYIGKDAVIGDDCVLYPNVTIYERCVLGNRVTLHAGCVIGQDGFGYATHKGAHHKIPQTGNAVIEDDVEMGANCSVDRATLGSTVVGAGTKFSNSVTIGHGTKVGRHNLLVGLVGIAGSVEMGDYVVIGGHTGVAGHLKIGNQAQLAAHSGIMTDVPDKEQWGGTPALPLTEAKRVILVSRHLPDLAARVKKLERQLARLQDKPRGESD